MSSHDQLVDRPGKTDAYEGDVFCDGRAVIGWVIDGSDPAREVIVELVLDGWPAQMLRAQALDSTLSQSGVADPFHGFVFTLPDTAVTVAEVRIANTDRLVGQPIRLTPESLRKDGALGPGRMTWTGGLRFEGWLPQESGPGAFIRGLIEEDVVIEARPCGWTVVPHGSEGVAARRLDFHLPPRFADGLVHRLDVHDQDGQPLDESPLTFLAFPDGLEAFLHQHGDDESQRLRARVFDERAPPSVPLAWIDAWLQRFPIAPEKATAVPKVAVVLFGETDVERSLASLEACGDDWILGVLPLDPQGRFHPQDLIDFISDAGASFGSVVFAPAGTRFEAGSLACLAEPLLTYPRAVATYGDVLIENDEGERLPLALCDFDYERMLEQGHGASVFAMRHALVLAATEAGAASAYRLFNFGLDDDGAPEAAPVHIVGFVATLPRRDLEVEAVLLAEATAAHLSARDVAADITIAAGFVMPAVWVQRLVASEAITIVIATRGVSDGVHDTVAALRASRTRHALDIVVASATGPDDSLDPAHFAHTRLIRVSGDANKARVLNRGVEASGGTFVGFLESGVVVPADEWLDELVGRCADPRVGGAGALLTWPNGFIREAGGVLGPRFGVGLACAGYAGDDRGYGDMLAVARGCAALSMTGFVTKRADFLSVGGFDDVAFGRVFHGVDYGLKLRSRHQSLVFTPHVRALQRGAGYDGPIEKAGSVVAARELIRLRSRWGRALADDPFYSPLLSLEGDLWSALACPPRRLGATAPRPVTSR